MKAGVPATEAFDLAGDSTVLPAQVSPATSPDKNMNLTEALRPWQPEKMYYFCNPTHDIFAGQGLQSSSKEISPSRHVSYGILAAEVFSHYRAQGGDAVMRAIDSHTLDSSGNPEAKMVTDDVQLILGKSLVASGVMDDVFAGVVPGGIPFYPAPPTAQSVHTTPALEIGDPWDYYRRLWRAHGLEQLQNIVPLEIRVKVGGSLAIPLIVENPLDQTIDERLSTQAPEGWQVKPPGQVSVGPHTRYFLRAVAMAPAAELRGWQEFTVLAEDANGSIVTIPVRVGFPWDGLRRNDGVCRRRGSNLSPATDRYGSHLCF